MRLFYFIIYVFYANAILAQRNKVFSIGYDPGVNIKFDNEIRIDTFFNTNQFLPRPIIGYGGSNICETNGNLVLMSNGYCVYNKLGMGLKNWEDFNCPFGSGLRFDNLNLFWTQMSTIIPKSSNQYYIFTSGMSDKAYWDWKTGTTNDDLYFDHLCYHIVDMDANNGDGEVLSKNNILMKDAFLCYDKMAAVQHGNGKDWWLVKQHKKKHKFYVFYITENNITLADSTDYNQKEMDLNKLRGQSVFSEDGMQYAFVSENYLNSDSNVHWYNFDRCTGKFSNYRKFCLPFQKDSFADSQNGVAFSPNGKYLYVSSKKNIWQIDLENTNNISNYVKIKYPDSIYYWAGNNLNLKLAPNGKIYIGNANNNQFMSYINNPDEFGNNCNLIYKGLFQNLTFLSIPPNNPKFGMGPLAGSPCDTIRPLPQAWVLYPNPTQEFIKIKVPNSKQGSRVQVQLYNMLGQKMVDKSFTINVDYEVQLSVRDMPRSVYVVKAKYGEEEFISKFVVNSN